MKKCDYRFEGRSTKTPKHDMMNVGSKNFAPQPPLGTKAPVIRKEQTRFQTKPQSNYHGDQFPNSKARRRSIP